MRISSETRILNFLLACFKRMQLSIRAIIEFDIKLQNNEEIKPDLFCFFPIDQNPYYSLFEYKKRSKQIITQEDLDDRIIPQYNRYLMLRPNDLDDTLIPKDLKANIYLNYLFYNSHHKSINQIINEVPIELPSNVYSMNLNTKEISEILAKSETSNYSLMKEVINLSKDNELWEKIYVPFTLNDILEIHGDNEGSIKLNRNIGVILTNSFLQFVISRKIRNEDTRFNIDNFIDYIFKYSYKGLNIGRVEKVSLQRKLRMFLYFVSDLLLTEINIPQIIKKVSLNEYQIIIRKTDTLADRVDDIREAIITFFTQTKITDFLNT